jgi:predicted amidophosphoribosyltransferase
MNLKSGDPEYFRWRYKIFCPVCGRRLDKEGKCPKCKVEDAGEYDPEQPLYRCPYCENNIVKIGSYCQRCGEKLEE